MSIAAGILSAVSIAAIIISAFVYRDSKKTIQRIQKMVESAVNEDFSESEFSEKQISKLESILAEYLAKNILSKKRIQKEQEHTKTLIADISHQTKTPISNILLYSELLGEFTMPQEQKELVNQITAQSEKLDFLVSSLVKASRLESGIISIHSVENKIYPVIKSAVDSLSVKASERNIIVEISRETDITAQFDAKWTEEALYNILDNAVKYNKEGGRIFITVREYELFCRIDIKDTGIGIAEEEYPKIFMRFYRSRDVYEKEGVGIGLYLSRQIIQSQGGYIKVSSESGAGSEFSVFLRRS